VILAKAGLWLKRRIMSATAADKEQAFCPYTHAVCALKQIAFISTEPTLAGRSSEQCGK
jgi:hypothetical protein